MRASQSHHLLSLLPFSVNFNKKPPFCNNGGNPESNEFHPFKIIHIKHSDFKKESHTLMKQSDERKST